MIHAMGRGGSELSAASLFRLQGEAAGVEVRKRQSLRRYRWLRAEWKYRKVLFAPLLVEGDLKVARAMARSIDTWG